MARLLRASAFGLVHFKYEVKKLLAGFEHAHSGWVQVPLDTRKPNLYVIGFVGGDQIVYRLLFVWVFVTEFEAVAVDGFEEQFLCAIVPVLVFT